MIKYKSEVLFSLFLVALGSFVIINTLSMPEDARLFPLAIGILLVIFSLITIFLEIRKKDSTKHIISRQNIIIFLLIVTSLFLFFVLLNWAGYIVAGIFLTFCTISINEPKRVLNNIFMSVLIVILVYLLFGVLLNVPLP